MREIKIEADLLKHPGEWHRQYNDARNAQAKELVARAMERANRPQPTHKDDREEVDENIAEWFFWQLRSRAPRESGLSDDALMLELVDAVAKRARDDERRRFSAKIASTLQTALGEDFRPVVYDIIDDEDMGRN